MMKMTNRILLFLACLTICISSCKPECEIPDDPSCRNYDPCWGLEEVTADFNTGVNMLYYVPERTGSEDTLWLTDTVLTGNLVIFEAKGNYDSYTWKIGEDPRTFTGPRVTTHFEFPEGDIQVTLIVESAVNSDCFPEDDGKDTLTKEIFVIDYLDAAILGRYRGSLDSAPLDTFEVAFYRDGWDWIFENINPGCEAKFRLPISISNNSMSFGDASFFAFGCNDPVGWMILDSTHQIVHIPYTFRTIDSLYIPRKERLFTGIKIK